jgi:hypothetical protein
MLYQLPNGKCVEISVEQYLRMSDEELNMFVAYNFGEEVNDPFALSVLRHGPATEKAIDEMSFYEETLLEDEDLPEDMTEVPAEEKLKDIDYVDLDNTEN